MSKSIVDQPFGWLVWCTGIDRMGTPMITALAQRIRAQCSGELSVFRDQVSALVWQDIGTGGLEGAATAMASRPSLASPGVTVDIVGFTEWQPAHGTASVGVTVGLRLDAGRSAAGVHWEEAHAWACAVADGPWTLAEFIGSEETPGGVVFHYLLKDQVTFYPLDELQGAL